MTLELTVSFSSSPLLSSLEPLSSSSSLPLGTAALKDGGPQVSTRYSFLLLELFKSCYQVSAPYNLIDERKKIKKIASEF